MINIERTQSSPTPVRQLSPLESHAVTELLITLHGQVLTLPEHRHAQAHAVLDSPIMRECVERLVVTAANIAAQSYRTQRAVRHTQTQSFVTAMFGEALLIMHALECTPDEDGFVSSSQRKHAAFNALVACVENTLSQAVHADQDVVRTLAVCLVNQPLFFGLCAAIGELAGDV